MKFGFCLSAFVIGCFMTIFMRANAPSRATAENSIRVAQGEIQLARDTAVETIEMKITEAFYGNSESGTPVTQFVCKNENGYVVELIDFGATISAFRAPDRDGEIANITLGCNDMDGYQACTAFLGSTVGRYANRIANGEFSIDSVPFQLAKNDGNNHLHGGESGFDKRIWDSQKLEQDGEVGVRFSLISKDGDEGYPGNLDVTVEYTLNNNNELRITYSATTDQTTHVNLTNHAYWNLAGATAESILNHEVFINADRFVTVNSESIPTGVAEVADTPLDFREPQTIGSRLDQIESKPIGYDHCFVIKHGNAGAASQGSTSNNLVMAATVFAAESGRKMDVLTTQPGVQLYTGNYLDGQPSSGGFEQHQALCLETQSFPDSPNRQDFPSTLLRPGQRYLHTTVYRFSVAK